MTTKITIIGYEREGHCDHCGRELVHCIKLDDGRVVGATCFDKKMTKPVKVAGRSFRIGSSGIIERAKVAQFANPNKWSQYGMTDDHFTFEKA